MLDVAYRCRGRPVDIMSSQIAQNLAERQLESGGWSYAGLQQASIETTFLSALGLAWIEEVSTALAIRFLLNSQRTHGAWPPFQGDPRAFMDDGIGPLHVDSGERRLGRPRKSIELVAFGAGQGRPLVLALEIQDSGSQRPVRFR